MQVETLLQVRWTRMQARIKEEPQRDGTQLALVIFSRSE